MDKSKVRMQKANAMGKAPRVGNGGGNAFNYGNSSQGNTGGASRKAPSSMPSKSACDKPKGAK